MSSPYQVKRLTEDQVDLAYVLAHSVMPKLELDSWRAYCRGVGTRGDGAADPEEVIVAANPAGHLQGLAICAAVADPVHHRVLDVSTFVVASASDDVGVAAEVLAELRRVAATRNCRGVRIWNWGQDHWSRILGGFEPRGTDGVLAVQPSFRLPI